MRTATFVGAVLALSACATHAQQYRMKEDEPRTGTLLKRDIARATIPYDMSYADLPDAVKARLRAMYAEMGPEDEPPFPATGYGHLMRTLAEVRRKVRIEGIFDLGVMVGPDGRATEIKVYRSPDPKLATVVANVLVLEKYKAALCGGTPCTQEFPFVVNFTAGR